VLTCIGRSLLLTKGDVRACATIIQRQEHISYAVVKGHISGDVHVRLVNTNVFAVLTDLFSTKSLTQSQTM